MGQIELNFGPLIMLFSVVAVICIVIILWFQTKSGKKWLKNL